MLTSRQAFKAAVLGHCAERGLTLAETLVFVKEAADKLAAPPSLPNTQLPTMIPRQDATPPMPATQLPTMIATPPVTPVLPLPQAIPGSPPAPPQHLPTMMPRAPAPVASPVPAGPGPLGSGGLGGRTSTGAPPAPTAVKQANPIAAAGIGSFLGNMLSKGSEKALAFPFTVAGKVSPYVLGGAALAAVGAPVAAGGLAGYAGAKLQEDPVTVEEAKAKETVSEYRRLADEARRNTRLKQILGGEAL